MSTTLSREPDRPHVAHLRVDANELNLLSPDEVRAVREAVESVPDAVSVLTITAGSGPDAGATSPGAADAASAAPSTADGEPADTRGLSAGLDLEWARDLTAHEGQDLLRGMYDMVEAVRSLDAVAVCGCGDYAIGAGFELAMGCEFRVATAGATLGLPETRVGIPTVIHGGLLLRLVGETAANELIYTGRTVDGTRAAELGLVTRAVPAAEYGETLAGLVDELAALSPLVLQVQKRVMRRFRSSGLEAGMAASAADIGRCFGTADQREAMAAFLEDREPRFSEP